MIDLDGEIFYRGGKADQDILDAAFSAAYDCACDRNEEILLDVEILDVEWLTQESATKAFSEYLKAPFNLSPDDFFRIDWQAWVISKDFTLELDKAITIRTESIYVDKTTLLNKEVFTYGFGPEYNWLHWQEISNPTSYDENNPPIEVIEAYCELLEGDWAYELKEYFEDELDLAFLNKLHPLIKSTIEKLLKSRY